MSEETTNRRTLAISWMGWLTASGLGLLMEILIFLAHLECEQTGISKEKTKGQNGNLFIVRIVDEKSKS